MAAKSYFIQQKQFYQSILLLSNKQLAAVFRLATREQIYGIIEAVSV